jgi:hypothetical protein
MCCGKRSWSGGKDCGFIGALENALFPVNSGDNWHKN